MPKDKAKPFYTSRKEKRAKVNKIGVAIYPRLRRFFIMARVEAV
jgi:hypothetical protein